MFFDHSPLRATSSHIGQSVRLSLFGITNAFDTFKQRDITDLKGYKPVPTLDILYTHVRPRPTIALHLQKRTLNPALQCNSS
jgi:hypothetical protein